MEERKKRPPINLSDLEVNKPGPERGSLGFAGVDRKESSGEGKKKVNLSQILLPVVIALALSALIMFQYAPSKAFLVSQVKVATDSAAALTTQLGSERGRIDAIVNSMGTYAKKTELDTYAKASQLSGLATTSQLSGYATTAQKDALEAEIVALKARIAVLEAAGVVGVSDNTTVDIDYYCRYPIMEEDTYSVSLTLNNHTGKVLKDTVIEFTLIPRTSSVAVVDRAKTSLDSMRRPYLAWEATYNPKANSEGPTKRITFISDEFDLAVGETELSLELTLAYEEGSETVKWTPDVYVDYVIK